jgi:hypothetical protein
VNRLELTGQRFGKWRVLGFSGIKNGHTYWTCRCDCGTHSSVEGTSLTQGTSGFCLACAARFTADRLRTHGMRHSPEYAIWLTMKDRCSNPRNQDWKHYGGRGIRVCRRWLRSFSAFFRDMGKRPAGRSIDRRNNDGDYRPGNCRWATALTQSRNRRRRR